MQILLSVMLLDKRHTIVSKHIWCRKDLKATKVICAVSFVVGHDLLKKRACSAAGIYKDAVFDTNRKSLLRHISAEKGLK